MSRTIPAAIATHIEGNVTSLALCMKVVRNDGVTSYHTTHDVDIVYGGDTYRANASFSKSDIHASSDFRTDDLEVSGILSVNDVLQVDVRAGLYDHCDVYLFYINYESPSDGIIKAARGFLGNVRILDGSYQAEIRSLHQLFNRSVLRHYTPLCSVDLGSTKCGVNLASYTFAGKVATVGVARESMTITEQSGLITEFDTGDYFTGGKIVWTGGNNNGYSCEIRKHYGSPSRAVELFVPSPYEFAVNDTFNIIRGCSKTITVCKNVFNNEVNHRGFPQVPGRALLERKFENQ